MREDTIIWEMHRASQMCKKQHRNAAREPPLPVTQPYSNGLSKSADDRTTTPMAHHGLREESWRAE